MSTTPAKQPKSPFFKTWFGFLLIIVNFVIDLIRILLIRYLAFFKRHPMLAIGIPVGLALFVVVAASSVAFFSYNYIMHNAKFCIFCHDIMIESYETWQTSEHKDINCHACHYMTPEYAIRFTISAIEGMPPKIPKRPAGKVIVPDKYCMLCHWSDKRQHGDAGEWGYWLFPATHVPENSAKVVDSQFHAVHFFKGPTPCTICHGQEKLHVFTSNPNQCATCHTNQTDQLHAAKATEMACLNCHTDQTVDLNPTREKCLACHSTDPAIQQTLTAANTIDVKYTQLSATTVANARKINAPKDAAMQHMNCTECHQAHPKETASTMEDAGATESCRTCHAQIETKGQHTRHVPYYQGNCMACHQPHEWNISEEWAQQECTKCHPYLAPSTFSQPSSEL